MRIWAKYLLLRFWPQPKSWHKKCSSKGVTKRRLRSHGAPKQFLLERAHPGFERLLNHWLHPPQFFSEHLSHFTATELAGRLSLTKFSRPVLVTLSLSLENEKGPIQISLNRAFVKGSNRSLPRSSVSSIQSLGHGLDRNHTFFEPPNGSIHLLSCLFREADNTNRCT